MSKLLLINGPRQCGKSEATRRISRAFPTTPRRCKDKLFTLVPDVFCLSDITFWMIYDDPLMKEVPLPEFRVTQGAYRQLQTVLPALPGCDAAMVDLSVRQAMIFVSEVVCKPALGVDYFGRARADSIVEGELAIDDSCGFVEELKPVINQLGQDNLLLVRVRGRGEFDGNDSRQFIPDGVIDNVVDVDNRGDEEAYYQCMLDIATRFYGEEHRTGGHTNNQAYNQRVGQSMSDELDNFVVNTGEWVHNPHDLVEIRRVDGSSEVGQAAAFDWSHLGHASSIYKYRVLEVE